MVSASVGGGVDDVGEGDVSAGDGDVGASNTGDGVGDVGAHGGCNLVVCCCGCCCGCWLLSGLAWVLLSELVWAMRFEGMPPAAISWFAGVIGADVCAAVGADGVSASGCMWLGIAAVVCAAVEDYVGGY